MGEVVTLEFDELGRSESYLAVPGNGKSGPGVLALHAWWGLNPFFRGFCDRLAADGFTVLAPDLYCGGGVATTVEEATTLRDGMNGDATYHLILAATEYLKVHPAVVASGVNGIAAIGFSLGAGWALCLDESIRAIVTFYGLTDPQYITADAPILGHFAAEDEWEPLESVRAVEAALKAAGKSLEFHVYEGTHHWFFESDRPEYDPPAAALAYDRTCAFLRRTLVPR